MAKMRCPSCGRQRLAVPDDPAAMHEARVCSNCRAVAHDHDDAAKPERGMTKAILPIIAPDELDHAEVPYLKPYRELPF